MAITRDDRAALVATSGNVGFPFIAVLMRFAGCGYYFGERVFSGVVSRSFFSYRFVRSSRGKVKGLSRVLTSYLYVVSNGYGYGLYSVNEGL